MNGTLSASKNGTQVRRRDDEIFTFVLRPAIPGRINESETLCAAAFHPLRNKRVGNEEATAISSCFTTAFILTTFSILN